ncbi:MAG: hypothetical protein ACE5HE_13345 [Phycisphaerae bacterium]
MTPVPLSALRVDLREIGGTGRGGAAGCVILITEEVSPMFEAIMVAIVLFGSLFVMTLFGLVQTA